MRAEYLAQRGIRNDKIPNLGINNDKKNPQINTI